MNENYDENKRDLLRNFILKLILIIVFVLLVIWLIPKATNKTYPDIDLSAIKGRIFSENIETMKDAATNYFTTDRLPSDVGDSTVLTLQDMYDNNLLVELTDKNNEACAVKDSYVELTKEDDEYLMKVNLKCGDEEDYVLVHMGCYNYCSSTAICEKESTVGDYTNNYINSIKGGNGSGSGNGSTSYSNGGTRLVGTRRTKTKTTTKTTTTTTKTSSIITTIKKITKKVVTDGNTSNTTDPDDPIVPDDPVKPTDPDTPDTPSEKKYLYEYVKVTSTTSWKWGSWSSWKTYKDSDGITAVTCDEKDFTCVKEVQTKKEFEKVGTYTKYYKREREESQKLSSYTAKYCASYNYVVYGSTIYYTTGSGYSSTSSGSWTKSGSPVAYTNPPADSATVRYVLTGADYDDCSNTCTTTPKFYYQKYVYKYSLHSTGTYTSSSSSHSVKVSCSNVVSKTVPVYANVKVYDIVEREEPAYAYVKYYRTRTRTPNTTSSSDTKWSYYNDTSLLNNGYTYTGRKKEK